MLDQSEHVTAERDFWLPRLFCVTLVSLHFLVIAPPWERLISNLIMCQSLKIWKQNINIFLCTLHKKINVENSFFYNGDALNPIVFHALFMKILNTKYFMFMC